MAKRKKKADVFSGPVPSVGEQLFGNLTDEQKSFLKHGKTLDVAQLKPDPKNARKHTPRNLEVLRHSLKSYGAGRSILVDENLQIIAGHGVVEAAADAGITKVRPVEASGDEIIAVVRRGLSDRQKTELAIADNRASDLSEWNTEQLLALDVELAPFFTAEELASMDGRGQDNGRAIQNLGTKPPPDMVWILVGVDVNRFGSVRRHIEALEKTGEITVKCAREKDE